MSSKPRTSLQERFEDGGPSARAALYIMKARVAHPPAVFPGEWELRHVCVFAFLCFPNKSIINSVFVRGKS